MTARFEAITGGMRIAAAAAVARVAIAVVTVRNANRATRSERAAKDLGDALKNKDTSPDVITAKLAALREAKAKAAEAVKASQEDLKSVLTARQEAVLVVNGMLE